MSLDTENPEHLGNLRRIGKENGENWKTWRMIRDGRPPLLRSANENLRGTFVFCPGHVDTFQPPLVKRNRQASVGRSLVFGCSFSKRTVYTVIISPLTHLPIQTEFTNSFLNNMTITRQYITTYFRVNVVLKQSCASIFQCLNIWLNLLISCYFGCLFCK